MPIYEFYCEDCNTIFNFYSRTVNTTKRPICPRCKKRELSRQISAFSMISGKDKSENGLPDIDEARLEKAMGLLASEAEKINEDDPRQAARLMRRFSEITGINLGSGMKEALDRMEAGEDPEKIEAEMADILEEEPFALEKKGRTKPEEKIKPEIDETLYEL